MTFKLYQGHYSLYTSSPPFQCITVWLLMQTVVLKVGMSCQGCVGAVKRVLGKMEGLSTVIFKICQLCFLHSLYCIWTPVAIEKITNRASIRKPICLAYSPLFYGTNEYSVGFQMARWLVFFFSINKYFQIEGMLWVNLVSGYLNLTLFPKNYSCANQELDL